MPVSTDLSRKLSIKVGVVKRYEKEIQYYRKELATQLATVDALRNTECCPHDLANKVAVGKETETVLKECNERYQQSKDDLRDFLVS